MAGSDTPPNGAFRTAQPDRCWPSSVSSATASESASRSMLSVSPLTSTSAVGLPLPTSSKVARSRIESPAALITDQIQPIRSGPLAEEPGPAGSAALPSAEEGGRRDGARRPGTIRDCARGNQPALPQEASSAPRIPKGATAIWRHPATFPGMAEPNDQAQQGDQQDQPRDYTGAAAGHSGEKIELSGTTPAGTLTVESEMSAVSAAAN